MIGRGELKKPIKYKRQIDKRKNRISKKYRTKWHENNEKSILFCTVIVN